MKILHTSDWHLGQILHGKDRIADHQSMLEQLVTIVKEQKPDAFVLAGDIYDTAQPTTSTQRFYAKAMVEIHNARPEMMIICISGNHDSGQRYEIFQTPWEALNVYTVGTIDNADPAKHIIEVRVPNEPNGELKGYVAAVPYANPYFVNDAFYGNLAAAMAEKKAATALPAIMINHLAASGNLDYTGHSKTYDKYIGGIDCTSIDELGTGYDYIALGHIHKAQKISSNPVAYYSGTPIPVSFDEVRKGYDHGVTLVDIPSDGAALKIEAFPIKPAIQLVNIPEEGFATWEEVIKELKTFDAAKEAYIRLNVLLTDMESLPVDWESKVQKAIEGKKAQKIDTNVSRQMTESADSTDDNNRPDLEVSELQKMEPIDMAKMILKDLGFRWPEDKMEEFESMFEEVHNLALELQKADEEAAAAAEEAAAKAKAEKQADGDDEEDDDDNA